MGGGICPISDVPVHCVRYSVCVLASLQMCQYTTYVNVNRLEALARDSPDHKVLLDLRKELFAAATEGRLSLFLLSLSLFLAVLSLFLALSLSFYLCLSLSRSSLCAYFLSLAEHVYP